MPGKLLQKLAEGARRIAPVLLTVKATRGVEEKRGFTLFVTRIRRRSSRWRGATILSEHRPSEHRLSEQRAS